MSAEVLDISSNRKYHYHPTPADYARHTEPAPTPAPLPPIPTLESPLSHRAQLTQWFCWGVITGFLVAGLVIICSRSHAG